MDIISGSIACALQNWKQSRRYEGSLAIRKEGFTEDWGDRDETVGTSTQTSYNSTGTSCIRKDDDDAPDDAIFVLQLFQYRPAWTEQLILKLTGHTFRVINSRYAIQEVTGALPCLRDATAMAGGHEDILAYLKLKQPGLFASSSTATISRSTEEDDSVGIQQQPQQRDSELLQLWIQERLTPALRILRYSHGADLLQREQIKEASKNYWLALLQMWTERVMTTRCCRRCSCSSISSSPEMDHDQALDQIRKGYKLLNDKLSQSTTGYMLGTDTPMYVDCLLWGHLMEAATNLHLIVVLKDYPALVSFLQTIYSRYHFGTATGPLGEWNVEENAANAFVGDYSQILGSVWYYQNQHLKTSVEAARRFRGNEASMKTPSEDPMKTWHRWCRDGPMLPTASNSKQVGTEVEPAMSFHLSKFHDDVWLISVVAATVALVLAVGFQDNAKIK